MLIIKSIVLFVAIIFTIIYIADLVKFCVKGDVNDTSYTKHIFAFLWSLFYYLTHY